MRFYLLLFFFFLLLSTPSRLYAQEEKLPFLVPKSCEDIPNKALVETTKGIFELIRTSFLWAEVY